MATFIQEKFSASTDGQPIQVAAVATAGDLIHTATPNTGETEWDQIWLYAVNNSLLDVLLTIEFGGVASKDLVQKLIKANAGTSLIIPGWILHNAKEVRAFAATTAVINIGGWIYRVT